MPTLGSIPGTDSSGLSRQSSISAFILPYQKFLVPNPDKADKEVIMCSDKKPHGRLFSFDHSQYSSSNSGTNSLFSPVLHVAFHNFSFTHENVNPQYSKQARYSSS